MLAWTGQQLSWVSVILLLIGKIEIYGHLIPFSSSVLIKSDVGKILGTRLHFGLGKFHLTQFYLVIICY